jgi:hypothetical protein
MTDKQAVNIDRIRLNGSWTAWWAVFSVLLVGVWYLRGAKSIGEQVVLEVRELRMEMREARDVMHSHDMRLTTLEEWKRSRSSTGNNW